MLDDLQSALGPVLTRWTTGGMAAQAAPEEWRAAIGSSGADAELALLALAGQLLGAMTVAQPTDDLGPLPDFPALPLPPVPELVRPLARRLVAATRGGGQRRSLLDFLAARGWTMHPGDWMPEANDEDIPDVYAPWRDWAALATGDTAALPGELLSEESWNDFGPAGRAAALVRLRGDDPEAARRLLEARIGGEPADSRLRLATALGARLSDQDRSFLETLLSDRAPKVKALAATLLARLGHRGELGKDAAELAGFFTVETRGLLRRTRIIVPRTLKTPAQRQRRQELLTRIDYPAFAAALEVDPLGAAAMWSWGADYQADEGIAAMIAASAPDAVVQTAVETLRNRGAESAANLALLLPRLTEPERREVAEALLRTRGVSFADAASIGAGLCRIADPMRVPAGAALLTLLIADEAGKSAAAAAELQALGLVASREGARRAIERLGQTGMLAADPRLDMLRLNAALDDTGETS
ncbi:DUF5691 domain-containing protein [Allosphingosinicella deserti]|uniref:Uncharacterized protein n=1 Tax=Allosphingosinicella deserti TaxID=2116704 RepID=A0A2P7QR49_9SPHN|nr:DUF5691 domain-containing protein [Sphingomonas deserti]PSJ40419.1 hypothetical protein C7I55_08745 [Sphingomonas deserti]